MIDLAPGLLRVRDLKKSYRSGAGLLHVLRGDDFDLEPGGFVAVVGSSRAEGSPSIFTGVAATASIA